MPLSKLWKTIWAFMLKIWLSVLQQQRLVDLQLFELTEDVMY